jgi:anti-anti-sigma factor
MVDLSPSPVATPALHVEQVKGATLITLTGPDLTGEAAQVVGGQLSRLAEMLGGRRFVLSLRGVRSLNSAMLGKFIAFHKRVKQAGGQLTLCSLTPELAARIADMRLDRLFHILPTEEEALGGEGVTPSLGPGK